MDGIVRALRDAFLQVSEEIGRTGLHAGVVYLLSEPSFLTPAGTIPSDIVGEVGSGAVISARRCGVIFVLIP